MSEEVAGGQRGNDLTQREKVMIMLAIMAAMLFAALNQTVVSTALPRIIATLGGIDYYSWVFTVFMLASSVTVILVGKLSDIYGRKPFILLGLGLFSLGSFLCGTSQTIFHLIAYRALQGLGAGMVMSTAMTAIGDIFAPRERGRWQGLMASVFGLASVIGPTAGGYIVDYWDWHWVFWVNLPVGVIAFLMVLKMFPKAQMMKGKERDRIDFLGSAFLVVTLIPILLAFSWAGTEYAWHSPVILSLFSFAFTGLVLFIVTETRVKSPVLPLNLFRNGIFTISNVVGFLTGIGMFGTIMYLPLFVQGVIGTTASDAGLVMIPMTLSMMTGSTISGQLTSATGKYKNIALGGLAIMFAGMLLMALMGVQTTNLQVIVNMILVGFGLGVTMPIFVLAVQNAFSNEVLGVVTSSTQLFRQLGGTIGVAVLGTVMARRMEREMTAIMPDELVGMVQNGSQFEAFANPQALLDPQTIAQLKEQIPVGMENLFEEMLFVLREALAYGLQGVYWIGAGVVGVALMLTFFLKELPLRGEIKNRRARRRHAG